MVSAIVTDFDRSIAEVDEENAVEFEVLYEGEGADYAVPYGLDLRKDELRIVDIVVPNGVEPHVYIPALRCLRRVSHISAYSEPHSFCKLLYLLTRRFPYMRCFFFFFLFLTFRPLRSSFLSLSLSLPLSFIFCLSS